MPDAVTTIVGNIGKDPELQYTAGGQAVAKFSVAVSNRWKPKGSEEWKEDTEWYTVVAWGTLGENVAASLNKGNRAVITGRMRTRTWETPEGERRYFTELVADEVAPSLRWATAQVEATERHKPSGEGYPYGAEEPF